ncbi:hypothetical protein ACFX1X_002189 [Malus domestica]
MGGDTTQVWVDRWIPALVAGHPTSIQGVRVEPSELVSSLIDPITHVWRIDSGLDQFRDEERGEILDTPIGVAGKLDRLIWPADQRVPSQGYGYQVKYVSSTARCDAVFNKKLSSPTQTVHTISSVLVAFKEARARRRVHRDSVYMPSACKQPSLVPSFSWIDEGRC